jgi:hypothetical protein
VPAGIFVFISGRLFVAGVLQNILSAFRTAKSTRQINDKAYQQNQAKTAAANGRTSKIKPAAAEQEKKNNDDQ